MTGQRPCDAQRLSKSSPSPSERSGPFDSLGNDEKGHRTHPDDMAMDQEQRKQHQCPTRPGARAAIRQSEHERGAIGLCAERRKMRMAVAAVEAPLLGGRYLPEHGGDDRSPEAIDRCWHDLTHGQREGLERHTRTHPYEHVASEKKEG